MHGFDRPIYTNVIYPFPLDPPSILVDNPTGCYRTYFNIPKEWKGMIYMEMIEIYSALYLLMFLDPFISFFCSLVIFLDVQLIGVTIPIII